LQNGKYKFIPYQQLFRRTTSVEVGGYGKYEGYANRDSLKYIETYGLSGIETMLRGTLRNEGFCRAWDVLVQLGCCDDSYQMENVNAMTHADFIQAFLAFDQITDTRVAVSKQLGLEPKCKELDLLEWSGFFSKESIGLANGTPAQILEHILNKKWMLHPDDKDMIVMWHRFRYRSKGKLEEIQSTLVAEGENSVYTAMAKTVGLPLAIAAKLVLQNKIRARGVIIPTTREFYLPILQELKTLGIQLKETHTHSS
jgi:saccharopine dehydrogenase-like NADP-dependent oxidoreductase